MRRKDSPRRQPPSNPEFENLGIVTLHLALQGLDLISAMDEPMKIDREKLTERLRNEDVHQIASSMGITTLQLP
jgi:hypothetical protein